MSTQRLVHDHSQEPNTEIDPNALTNVGYPYNGILLGSKKEPTTKTFNNMDKPQNHYSE